MHHRPNNLRLGQILIHLDAATHEQVIEARTIQQRDSHSTPIGEILVDLDYITEDDLYRALSLQKDLDMNI